MELAALLQDWERHEEALGLESFRQHAGLPYDEGRMQQLAGLIEDAARRGLETTRRDALPPLLWSAMVSNAGASELTRLNNEVYRQRNEEVKVVVAGETVNLNSVRAFNRRHLSDAATRKEAFDALMTRASLLTPTLRERFGLSARLWKPYDLTPLDVYLIEEGLDLDTLTRAVDGSATRAKPAFLSEAETFSQEILGKPMEAFDDMYVFRHAVHAPVEDAFAEVDPVGSFAKVAKTLGFGMASITIDGEAREGKYASPVCFGVRIPGDVRVLYQQTAPVGDYESFYHEMGHAVHFASVDPQRAFHERRLMPNGVVEIFSTLFEAVAFEPRYLEEDLGLPADKVAEVLRRRRFMELYFLTFYGANSMHKIRFWAQGLHEDFAAADRLYEDLTEQYMGVRYPGVYWQTHHVLSTADMYAPSYLLANVRRAELVRVLRKRFGDAWWREPAAGEWLRTECMGPGASLDLASFSRLDVGAYVDPIVAGAGS